MAGWDRSDSGCSLRGKQVFLPPNTGPLLVVEQVYSCPACRQQGSSTIFCEVSARGELVVTSMPCVGKRQHEGASTAALDLHHAGAAVSVRALVAAMLGAGCRRRASLPW